MFNRIRFDAARFNGLSLGGTPTPTPTPTPGSFVGTELVAVLLLGDAPFGSDTGYTAVLLSADDPFGVDAALTQLTMNSIEPSPLEVGFLLIDAGSGFLLIDSTGPDRVLLDG